MEAALGTEAGGALPAGADGALAGGAGAGAGVKAGEGELLWLDWQFLEQVKPPELQKALMLAAQLGGLR